MPWSIRIVSLLSVRFHLPMSMMHRFMNQPLKHLRFRRCKIIPRSSPQMQPTTHGRFASITGNEGSRAISRSTGDLGNTRSEEEPLDSIRNSTRSAVPLDGSSAWIEASKKITPRYGRYEITLETIGQRKHGVACHLKTTIL